MPSAAMGYQLRILDIIWASFGGDYSLVFSSHFWHSFDAFFKECFVVAFLHSQNSNAPLVVRHFIVPKMQHKLNASKGP